jgi:hypothetical protein
VYQYIRSPIRLHGVVLNQLNTGTALPFFLGIFPGGTEENDKYTQNSWPSFRNCNPEQNVM